MDIKLITSLKNILALVFILLLNADMQGQKNSNPCPIDADIWVLAGQSNMAGAGRTLDTLTNPNVYMLNMDNRWMIAQEPIHRIYEAAAIAHEITAYELLGDKFKSIEEFHKDFEKKRAESKQKPIGGVGPGLSFAKFLNEKTGRSIGIIPCAHGGATMKQWKPDKSKGDSTLYGAMINRINSVGGKIKGLIWYQGESEAANVDTETYEKDLINLFNSIRKDIGNPELPIIYVQIGRFIIDQPRMNHSWEKIREIQRSVAGKMRNIFFTTGIDLPLDDCIHISAEGQKRLGRRIAELVLSYVYKLPDHGKQIDLNSISILKDNKNNSYYVKVSFKGISGCLNSCGLPGNFEMRIKEKINIEYVISKVEVDPDEQTSLRLYMSGLPKSDAQIICGSGVNPYMNVTDSLDMPIPAFGPIELDLSVK